MRDIRGFSLVEILVVVAIMGVLMSMAVPGFIDWKRSSTYREAARNLHEKMRLARNYAIEQNTEYRVEVDVDGGRVRLTRGNRSSNSETDKYIPVTLLTQTLTPTELTALEAKAKAGDLADVGWEWLANVGNGYRLRAHSACTSTDDVDFHFNTNGSAVTDYICIMTADPVPVKRFRVGINVASTGRAVVEKEP